MSEMKPFEDLHKFGQILGICRESEQIKLNPAQDDFYAKERKEAPYGQMSWRAFQRLYVKASEINAKMDLGLGNRLKETALYISKNGKKLEGMELGVLNFHVTIGMLQSHNEIQY